MEFVLFFLAVAMIAGQHGEISKLKKRVEALQHGPPETASNA